MYSHLLKRALPFMLTLTVGVAAGGLFQTRRADSPGRGSWHGSRRESARGERHGRKHCRMRRHRLVAETKPLVILFKPDAVLPHGWAPSNFGPASVLVTFGSDGKIHAAEPLDDSVNAWRRLPAAGADPAEVAQEAVERAAQNIQFVPETVDGMPVTVTREVEIRFLGE